PGFATIGTVNPSATSLPKGPTKGNLSTWNLYGDWTTKSKDLTVDGLFTDTRINRFQADFNNILLHLRWFRGGITYRPADKWSILAGYSAFQSVGPGRYLRPLTNNTGVPL